MSDDPWAAFIPSETAAPVASEPSAAPANDPWAAFITPSAPSTQADGAPLGLANVPTSKDDPVYRGAVPVAQAPDQGAATAFTSGVGGVPVIGPAIEGGLQRAAAAARSAMGGGSYGTELQHVQDMTDIARRQHPSAAFAGDLTGATLALAPATAASPAAFGLGPGGITAGKLGMGALSGAGLGGADAAVRAGSPGAVTEGLVGGLIGGVAAPMLGAAASRVGGALADATARMFAPPPPGVSRPVADIISRTVANDGALGQVGAGNIAAAGPYGMLVDASPSLTKTLDAALQRGGPGTAAARDAITARTAATNADLAGTLDRTLGPAQGVASATVDIRNGSAAARQAAYDAAYDTPIDYTSDHGRTLEDMINNRVPQGIVARAQNQMRVDGMLPSSQTMASIAPDGSVSYRQMPDVRMVDYITRSLHDVARAGDGQGALGGNTSEGRSYGALARDLRSTLRNAVPAYGDALDTAAQPIQERNALDFGASLLHPSTPTDIAAATVADMTGPELAHARAGARAHIAEAVANARRTAANPDLDNRQAMTALQMLSSDAARQKLGMLVGPQEQEAMSGALDRTARSLDLQGGLARNSATFTRGVMDNVTDQAAQPGILSRSLLAGGPIKATRPILEVLTGNRPADIMARKDAISGELASVLTGSQGQAAGGMLDALLRSHAAQQNASSIAGAVPYGQLAHAGIFAPLLALQQGGPQ